MSINYKQLDCIDTEEESRLLTNLKNEYTNFFKTIYQNSLKLNSIDEIRLYINTMRNKIKIEFPNLTFSQGYRRLEDLRISFVNININDIKGRNKLILKYDKIFDNL